MSSKCKTMPGNVKNMKMLVTVFGTQKPLKLKLILVLKVLEEIKHLREREGRRVGRRILNS